jgi:hypothetical protein
MHVLDEQSPLHGYDTARAMATQHNCRTLEAHDPTLVALVHETRPAAGYRANREGDLSVIGNWPRPPPGRGLFFPRNPCTERSIDKNREARSGEVREVSPLRFAKTKPAGLRPAGWNMLRVSGLV